MNYDEEYNLNNIRYLDTEHGEKIIQITNMGTKSIICLTNLGNLLEIKKSDKIGWEAFRVTTKGGIA